MTDDTYNPYDDGDSDSDDDEKPEAGDLPVLPAVIPVFPLTGAVLLPETQLPLNIFEPRYLKMVRDAKTGNGLIGMIQPREQDPSGVPALYSIGTVGHISQFEETGDGRIIIVLDGVSRFRIIQEIASATPYRQVTVDWSPYALDGAILGDMEEQVDRSALMTALKAYLEASNLSTDFDVLDAAPTTALVANLAVALPFEPAEKQALLEAQTVAARAEIMIALFEMAQGGTEPGMAN